VKSSTKITHFIMINSKIVQLRVLEAINANQVSNVFYPESHILVYKYQGESQILITAFRHGFCFFTCLERLVLINFVNISLICHGNNNFTEKNRYHRITDFFTHFKYSKIGFRFDIEQMRMCSMQLSF